MRQEHTLELKAFQVEYLQQMVGRYDLPGMGKAIRCLIDYAIEEEKLEEAIFKWERCHSCD